MSIQFNAAEIFDIAVQIEKNGYTFYRLAAEKTEAAGLKEKLLRLADMETDHEKTFLKMKDNLAGNEQLNITYDPFDETQLYLKAFADGRVFNPKADMTKAIAEVNTAEEILKKAIGFEKDSIVFYLGMKEMVPVNFGRDKVDKIISQEMGHISILSRELSELA